MKIFAPWKTVARPGWLGQIVLCLVLAFPAAGATAAEPNRMNDDYWRGYVAAVLEGEFHWDLTRVVIQANDGRVTVTVPWGYPIQDRSGVTSRGSAIPGLKGFQIVESGKDPVKAFSQTHPVRGSLYQWLGIDPEPVFLPLSDPFQPLLADLKEPHFFVSYRRYEYRDLGVNAAAVGFGENFGLYRRGGLRQGDGLQLGISAAVFAQFNLDAPSMDLINADYIVGFPVSYRSGPFSSRLRIYHQSSHLGDEYLLRNNPERINLSYESLELLFSYDFFQWRGYWGGEYLFHREPDNLKPAVLHGGLEYRGAKNFIRNGRIVGGLDLKSYQEHSWSIDISANVGIELTASNFGQRRIRFLLEAYHGFAPHGQFYNEKISFYGMQVGLSF